MIYRFDIDDSDDLIMMFLCEAVEQTPMVPLGVHIKKRWFRWVFIP
jgi:hypothetical protein